MSTTTKITTTTITGPLTAGQWDALLYQVPDQVRGLAFQLAIFHGARERPTPAECPICGHQGARGEQMALGVNHGQV